MTEKLRATAIALFPHTMTESERRDVADGLAVQRDLEGFRRYMAG